RRPRRLPALAVRPRSGLHPCRRGARRRDSRCASASTNAPADRFGDRRGTLAGAACVVRVHSPPGRSSPGPETRAGRRWGRLVTVNVVCVGAGWAAQERHLPSLVSDPRGKVIGVVDRHADRAEAVARKFSIPRWSTSLDEKWDSEVACLTIGAPPWAHGDLIEQALERGWHCLCEKPFVLPAARGAALVERAAGQGLVLAVVHTFQFSRAGRRLFELIETGRLGDLTAVYGYQLSNPKRRLPHWAAGLPGGVFLDETPHFLYLLRRILGRLEVRTVDARLDANAVRDIWITLDHESIWAQLSMSFSAPVFECQLILVDAPAAAAIDILRDLLLLVPHP